MIASDYYFLEARHRHLDFLHNCISSSEEVVFNGIQSERKDSCLGIEMYRVHDGHNQTLQDFVILHNEL